MFGASALLLIVIYLGNAWWKVERHIQTGVFDAHVE